MGIKVKFAASIVTIAILALSIAFAKELARFAQEVNPYDAKKVEQYGD